MGRAIPEVDMERYGQEDYGYNSGVMLWEGPDRDLVLVSQRI